MKQYYIVHQIETKKGININMAFLVDEDETFELKISQPTEKGYRSEKPIIVDFDYTINEDGEMCISEEVAAYLIVRYSSIEFKSFTKYSKYNQKGMSMSAMVGITQHMGDHGDTSGKFSDTVQKLK